MAKTKVTIALQEERIEELETQLTTQAERIETLTKQANSHEERSKLYKRTYDDECRRHDETRKREGEEREKHRLMTESLLRTILEANELVVSARFEEEPVTTALGKLRTRLAQGITKDVVDVVFPNHAFPSWALVLGCLPLVGFMYWAMKNPGVAAGSVAAGTVTGTASVSAATSAPATPAPPSP